MKIQLLVLFTSAALLLSACTTVSSSYPKPQPVPLSGDCSQEIKLGGTLLNAVKDNDFQAFKECLKDGPAEKLTKNDFETSRNNSGNQFGKIKNFHFLTALKTPAVRNLIWKVTFERKGSDGKTIEQELLFRLVTGMLDGKPVVLSFGFL